MSTDGTPSWLSPAAKLSRTRRAAYPHLARRLDELITAIYALVICEHPFACDRAWLELEAILGELMHDEPLDRIDGS